MLAVALDALAQTPEAEIIRGRPLFMRSDEAGWQAHDHAIEALAAGALTLRLITRGPLAINSMVFRRELLTRIGPFDGSLRLAADREWMLRAWRAGAKILELDRPFYCYRVHRGSSTLDPGQRNHRRAREEHAVLLRRVLPAALQLGAGDPLRIELRRWHAVETALRLRATLVAGGWREAARLWAEAGRSDPAWPLILAGQLGMLLRRRWAARGLR
jgi:hypothetical protein